MNALEDLVNTFSDRDREWWPFIGLRPAKDQRMKNRVILALAVVYGLLFGIAFNVIGALAGLSIAQHQPWVAPLAMVTLLFGLYRTFFIWAWNRRATRLVTAKAVKPARE